MSGRISATIRKTQEEKRLAFIGLVPIDPYSMDKTMEVADMMIDCGVDIVMIHIPNCLPWMEGKVLQLAARYPRNNRVTREDIFDFIKKLRNKYPNIPLVDMTLYDTVMTMGQARFLELSERADVDGFDLPNYPLFQFDDQFDFYKECLRLNRDLILAISYEVATAKEGSKEYELLREMCRYARGFAFVMNAPGGQSGSDNKLTEKQLTDAVCRVKQVMKEENNTDCSVSIVCGISSADDLKKVKASTAESFMIGSAYIKMIADNKSMVEISTYLKNIRDMCYFEDNS